MNDKPKKKKAAALSYQDGRDFAPKMMAAGSGYIADKILQNRGDIPVIENADLVDELTRMDLGAHIPPELYEVVAQILMFVSELDNNQSAK